MLPVARALVLCREEVEVRVRGGVRGIVRVRVGAWVGVGDGGGVWGLGFGFGLGVGCGSARSPG